jgi:hypothetical protein
MTKFWRHIEERLITREHLYYIGGTLCVDNENKPGGIGLNLNGKGFIYSGNLKNSTVYIPKHISELVHQIYRDVKGEGRYRERGYQIEQGCDRV